ncbi:hypothetical protein LSCM1_02177 [Leishmania martiniquensis]|uniref:Uncharacterized protein n=1 Tax=Leishmania martiniquensis TaxID=1580590 RepID=A0A836KC32_9TRYP|nr:hypothetical protein LSCM1_02177 [Leishmania martiniquensis]
MSAAREQQSASVTPSAAASPYICLSTQCDMLYRVGALPHSFAFISEQSVYTRAAEQLRYATPSPSLLPGVGEYSTRSDAAAPRTRDDEVSLFHPRVYMSPPSPNPFPPIERVEAAREAAREQAERQAKAHDRCSTAPARGSGSEAKPLSREHGGLVPSGPLLAQRTYHQDYDHRGRRGHTDTSTAAPHCDAAEQTAGSLIKDSTSTTSPSLQLMFPSPVLLRAVAQLVLAMQASSTSAARFSLAQYRGVQLLPWRASLHEAQESIAPSTPRLPPEALVLSVLPQVVADRSAARARAASDPCSSPHTLSVPSRDAATLYALTPFAGPHAQLATRGAKRAREETQGTTQDKGAVEDPSAVVLAGAVLCERLATDAETSAVQRIPVRYAAVTADDFEGWVPCSGEGDSSRPLAPSSASCAAEPFFYEEESTWMTDGVFCPLFSLPLAPPTETALAGDASAPTAEHDSSRQSTTHATFVKTSAFLFLSFAVHRSWCVHVHLAVTQALAAHRLPFKAQRQAGAGELAFTGSHVTCLPPVQEVQRPPQYEWRSALVYRAYAKQASRCAAGDALRLLEGDRGVREAALARGTAAQSLRYGPALWQLTILVVNRRAQLEWGMCNASPAHSAAASLRPSEHEGILEGSGSLDDLLQQL